METTIDAAGRLVLPKKLREGAGIGPGRVRIVPLGSGLFVEPAQTGSVVERDGLLLLGEGPGQDVEQVRSARLDDQR